MAFLLFNQTNIAYAKGMPELVISLDEVAILHDLMPIPVIRPPKRKGRVT